MTKDIVSLAKRLLLHQANDLRRFYCDDVDRETPSPDKPWAACVQDVIEAGGPADPAAAFRVMALDCVGNRMRDLERMGTTDVYDDFLAGVWPEWDQLDYDGIIDLYQAVLTLDMEKH